MKDVKWVNNLKLRASYGETGNDNILDSDGDPDYYPYQTLYGLGYKNGSEAGAYFTVIANPSLNGKHKYLRILLLNLVCLTV